MKEFKTIHRISGNGGGPLSKLSWDEIVNTHLNFGWEPAGPVYLREYPFYGQLEHMPLLREKPAAEKIKEEEQHWENLLRLCEEQFK